MVFNDDFLIYYKNLLSLKQLDTDSLYFKQRDESRPIIYRDTTILLQQMILMKQPENVLEIGTNGGYSAIAMSKMMTKGRLHTIEFRIDNLIEAKKNFSLYDCKNIIPHHGRAEEILTTLDLNFDFIFIDADKGGYPLYLDYAVKHLNDHGVIAVDNVLWKGTVFEKSENEKPSSKTLRAFNDFFMRMEGFKTIILPVGDGLAVAVKE
ncbi:MAG: O-methyltransferase [Candidatus Delongbacteria bacterium]|nr:O-methyltransferase [Candidatus Delongbacteria bacterium]MBN2836780.1 O-methyltransferase [Candidatus Delongbacteria bacterium]